MEVLAGLQYGALKEPKLVALLPPSPSPNTAFDELSGKSLMNGEEVGVTSLQLVPRIAFSELVCRHVGRSISGHWAITNVGQIRAVQYRSEHSLLERREPRQIPRPSLRQRGCR